MPKYDTEVVAQEREISETIAIYDQWANDYNDDAKNGGLIGCYTIAKFFEELELPKTAKVIDIGAGTGNIGDYLKKRGFSNLHALDGSQKMLDVAEKRNAYKTLTKALLGEGHVIPLANDSFDAAVMAGIFVPGHVGPDAFPEIIRLVKPGGIVCWGMRDPQLYAPKSDIFKDNRFHEAVMTLCSSGHWKLEKGPILLERYNETLPGQAYVMRVL